MNNRALRLAIYPLLLVNLAVGFFMFAVTHQAILIATDVLHREEMLANETLGPYTYVQQSVSGFGIIFLALLALILVPVLDSYYTRRLTSGRELLRRFVFVLGIQLCYLSIVQIVIRIISGMIGFDTGMAVIALQLVAGIGMILCARSIKRRLIGIL